MRNLNIILAVVGGAVAGAAIGMLFAPEKGEDLRAQIKELMKKKGICGCGAHVDEVVEQITAKIEG